MSGRPQGQRGLEESLVEGPGEARDDREFHERKRRLGPSDDLDYPDRVAAWIREREAALEHRRPKEAPASDAHK